MCGIVGIFAYAAHAGRPRPAEMVRMCESMSSRGPDGAESWQSDDGAVLLSHRRLAIIDPSPDGAQPMESRDRRYVVTFNGEIYNHAVLRASLERRGHVFRTRSDTEVLLALFAEQGEQALVELEGMFAFAIHDRLQRSLFLARDPYGIKPLYLADDGKTLRFASQVKALLAGGHVDAAPDPAGLAGFALFGHVPEPFTLHAGISALPAGHCLTVRGGVAETARPFASVAHEIARAPKPREADVVQACREAVRESVNRHLVADTEVGIFLSAGVDSGALLGIMRDAAPSRPLHAITLAFDAFRGTACDEAPLARAIAEHYGAKHRIRKIHADEVAGALPALLASMDQPSIDGINTWFVAKAAREAGLKVALSGVGGDELFGGYSTFRTLPATVRMAALPAAVPGLGRGARSLGAILAPRLRRDNPKALAALELGGTWPGAYLLRRGLFMPHEIGDLIGHDVARAGLQRLEPLSLIGHSLASHPGSAFRRVAALEAGNYLRNQLLRDADWAGMAHSVEIRTPLVDFPLLKRIAPFMDHFAKIGGKAILAGTPSRPLPPDVLSRPKSGFAVPTESWLSGQASTANTRLTSRAWARQVLAAFCDAPVRRAA